MNEDMIVSVDANNSVLLEEYNEVFDLLALKKGQNGVWYKVWVFLSKWQKGGAVPDDKKRPMAVRLGKKEQALDTLKMLLSKLEGI